jgi:hypothetical protein
MAVAALTLGILGLIMFPLALLAFIFGLVGHAQVKRTGQAGAGLAIAGIVLGGLVTGGVILVLLVLYNAFGM